jgi:uridine kinase
VEPSDRLEVSMGTRGVVLAQVADRIQQLLGTAGGLVAIDGVDGVGKSFFADELAAAMEARGMATVRASVDGFHHPPATRYRRGRASAEGFYLDSYRYGDLERLLLRPFGPGGDRRYWRAIYDVEAEQELDLPVETAPAGSVLVLDGIFLHRPELRDRWDLSVFLDAPFEVTVPRGAQRGSGSADPRAPSNRRYVEGQRLYLARCRPRARATLVIDNTDLDDPRIVRGGGGPPAGVTPPTGVDPPSGVNPR